MTAAFRLSRSAALIFCMNLQSQASVRIGNDDRQTLFGMQLVGVSLIYAIQLASNRAFSLLDRFVCGHSKT